MGSMLRQVEALPEAFIDTPPPQLAALLGGPTLVHLSGRREHPLFVSVLQHGNETTGLLAVQALLERYYDRELPRSLSLFIGNVDAACDGLRRLAGQPDYNRVWPGSVYPDTPEKRMMREVFEIMQARQPFASVDVHNNTGINPHYACINRLDHHFVQLASLFSRTLVYFTRPEGVQSLAFAEICPAVTVECGKVGQAAGEQHALEFLDACLHLNEFPEQPVVEQDVDVFHTVAIVRVPRSFSFGFGDAVADISFIEDLDHLNFRELPVGSTLASLNGVTSLPLTATDEEGNEVASRYFTVKDGLLQTARALMPSMFTLDERVIRQDCLGYLMERYPLPNQ